MEANKRHGVADGWVYRVAINHHDVWRAAEVWNSGFFRRSANARPSRSRWRDWKLVASLSERQRQVVMLRHVAEMSGDEIGTVLGIIEGRFKHSARRPSAIGPPARRRKRTLGDYACHN